MNRISLALVACGVAIGGGVASAQGLGGGLQNKPDPAQVQQKIQEQMQQRIQAQAEARARAQAQVQAQRAAERVQQRLEAQAQNQAARAEAAAQRVADGVQQRVDAQANAAARMRAGTQTAVDSEAGLENPDAPFGPFNPIRAAAGLQVSANARARANGNAQATSGDATPTTQEPGDEEAGTRPSRGLRVGQFTDLRGTARAELARTMALRLTAISAMRDRAVEAEDVQLLERADRLEAAVRRVLDARARGEVDVQAETVVEAELPATGFESPTDGGAAAGGETGSAVTQP